MGTRLRVQPAAQAALQTVMRDGYLNPVQTMQTTAQTTNHRPGPTRHGAQPAPPLLTSLRQRQPRPRPQPAGPEPSPTWEELFGQR